jgi:hypothetical protein
VRENHGRERWYANQEVLAGREIVSLLRQIEVAIVNVEATPQASRDAGSIDQELHRWLPHLIHKKPLRPLQKLLLLPSYRLLPRIPTANHVQIEIQLLSSNYFVSLR